MYKVRFNLGRGDNYMKWKVTNTLTKEVNYLEPNDFTLELTNAKLFNSKATANKIKAGANKTACSWIMCDDIDVRPPLTCYAAIGEQVRYNPRVLPYWHDESGQDIDGSVHEVLITLNNKLYKHEERN